MRVINAVLKLSPRRYARMRMHVLVILLTSRMQLYDFKLVHQRAPQAKSATVFCEYGEHIV